MRSELSLITLNIERDKHLDLVVPFLREQDVDVVCLQELFEFDIPLIEELAGPCAVFAPMMLYPTDRGLLSEGVGIFSRLSVESVSTRDYAGKEGDVVEFSVGKTAPEKYATQKYRLAVANVRKGEDIFSIATTHFLWTPSGEADELQRESVKSLLNAIEGQEVVLCGDFNAPRGKEIFSTLASALTDNIPPAYTTSIDGGIHRAGPLPYMVDGLFTTKGYSARNVALHDGVSDHMAVSALIAKAR